MSQLIDHQAEGIQIACADILILVNDAFRTVVSSLPSKNCILIFVGGTQAKIADFESERWRRTTHQNVIQSQISMQYSLISHLLTAKS